MCAVHVGIDILRVKPAAGRVGLFWHRGPAGGEQLAATVAGPGGKRRRRGAHRLRQGEGFTGWIARPGRHGVEQVAHPSRRVRDLSPVRLDGADAWPGQNGGRMLPGAAVAAVATLAAACRSQRSVPILAAPLTGCLPEAVAGLARSVTSTERRMEHLHVWSMSVSASAG
jgi:hypothetical protein